AACAHADDGAVGQVAGYFILVDGVEQTADGKPGIAEVDAPRAAGAAARIHRPLHAERVGDVAGNLDDGRFHHYLRSGDVELAHDGFQGADQFRLGQHDQRVEAFVGADQDVLWASGRYFAIPRRGQALGDIAQGFRQCLGVVVAQTDDARVGRACTRRIEGLREAGELLPGLCRAG